MGRRRNKRQDDDFLHESDEEPQQKIRKVDPRDRALAKAYVEDLGVNRARSLTVYRWRNFGGVGWRAADAWDLEHRDSLVRWGITNSTTRIDLRGLTHTNLVIFDVDVHGDPPLRKRTFRERTMAAIQRKQREADRVWRAELAREAIERLHQEVPVGMMVERSSRGFHVVLKLSSAVPVDVAASFASAIVARVPSFPGVSVEAFPRPEADGTGSLCSLPLLGIHLEVQRDLVTPMYGRAEGGRRAAVAAFLAHPGHELEELLRDDALDDVSTGNPTEEASSKGGSSPVTFRPSSDQLFGEDFAVECLRILKEGIPKGEHYDTCRRIIACFFYVSENGDEARARYEKWIAKPIHESWHAQHDPRHLMRDFECQLRHFERGVDAGRCRWNGMKSEKIRAVMEILDFGRYAVAA